MNAPDEPTSSHGPGKQLLAWLVWGIVLLIGVVLIGQVWPSTHGWDYKRQNLALTLTCVSAGLLFLMAMAWLRHSKPSCRGLAWIGIAGLAMRVALFVQPPSFETDYFRFMWDGAVTAHGVNPFAHSPEDIIDNKALPLARETELVALRESNLATLKKINHPRLTTIYPPVAQAFFATAYWISPFDPNALRGLLLVADAFIAILLVAMLVHLRLPLHWVALYWWNPILIKEFYLAVHIDALVSLLAFSAMCAAIWGRRWMGIVLLALAIGTKLWPIVLAPLLIRYRASSARQTVSGIALLAVLSLLLTLPLLMSWGRDNASGVTAYATHWISNAGFFSIVDSLCESIQRLLSFFGIPVGKLSRGVAVALLLAWMLILATRHIPDARSLSRWSMLAVGGMFVVSPTQFPWYFAWVLPFLALSPSRALLLYSALLPFYHIQYDHPWVLWLEHLPVWMLIAWGVFHRSGRHEIDTSIDASAREFVPPSDWRVSVIIPALNEEHAIGKVIANVPGWVTEIIVVDNGCTDNTASVAQWAGARVVRESERGYGAACLAGIAAADRPDVIVFMDGDFSDSPQEMERLVEPIVDREAELVIGSRVLGKAEAGSLTPQQRFGNTLACLMMRVLYGVRHTDLGPFRAIHAGALKQLAMDDRNFGWTVQMQVRAARRRLRSIEVPVSYRRRIGVSKISGTIRGVFAAGTKIITTILREGLRRPRSHAPVTDQVIVLARFPEPGRAKTRLIPLLGPAGAALLHRQLVMQTLNTVRGLFRRRPGLLEVRFTGSTADRIASLFGKSLIYRQQSEGDLGERLHSAAAEAFARGMTKVILTGTDCPLLNADVLESALAALDNHDVVLGPAEDGGYYLIGLRAAHKPLFTGIDWGGPTVLQQTIDACRSIGATYALLPALPDVDTPADLAAWGSARLARPDTTPRMSIIIPTHNEQDHLAATIASALTATDVEIIVVDCGSTDRTREIAQAFRVKVESAVASRGIQLNHGATCATSSHLLFLHADTWLPNGYVGVAERMLQQAGVCAGAFTLKIDADGIAPRMIEHGVKFRANGLGLPYGDQAMFMTQNVFNLCDGFPELPRMEDYAMLKELQKIGSISVASQPVMSSARRWQRAGWLRITLWHQWLILKHEVAGRIA